MLKVSSTFYSKCPNDSKSLYENNIITESDDHHIESESYAQDLKYCSVCYVNESNAIFLECGHSGICYKCACDLYENFKKCHICRADIEKLLMFKSKSEKTVEITKCLKIK